ncbi:hypothetical protein HDE_07471 [Halotydeus destructor]|nr:hypothetical protein HDE_07471 [Halotydeus destructor]
MRWYLLLLTSVLYYSCQVQAIFGTVDHNWIMTESDDSGDWSVIVRNQGTQRAHLWCASAHDRIGDKYGLWVEPGKSLSWSFEKYRFTEFWCTLDWGTQEDVGWTVIYGGWKDAPNPTRWYIRDSGIYSWDNRKWKSLRRQ